MADGAGGLAAMADAEPEPEPEAEAVAEDSSMAVLMMSATFSLCAVLMNWPT